MGSGKALLEEIEYQSQRLEDKVADVEKAMPLGAVWLDVRGRAEALGGRSGPPVSLALEHSEDRFSAREQEVMDKATGTG